MVEPGIEPGTSLLEVRNETTRLISFSLTCKILGDFDSVSNILLHLLYNAVLSSKYSEFESLQKCREARIVTCFAASIR
jgi:hypothetical protein